MPNVTLLHSPTCGACPSAKRLWKELRVKYSFSYREVDITTTDGQELANRHSVRAVPASERGKGVAVKNETSGRIRSEIYDASR